jgi:GAF domain-containing protein
MRSPDRFGVRNRERLADVVRLGLDREADRHYLRDIVERAASLLSTPFAVIDVLLDDAQIFLDGVGPIPEWIQEAGGTPLEWAFCGPLVRDRAARATADLIADPLFRDNPLVTIEGVRAYAGAPLISHTGQVLGGLCGLDVRPHSFRAPDLERLQELADEAVELIEARVAENALG